MLAAARSFKARSFSAWADWARRFAASRMLPVEVTSRERSWIARLSDFAASEGGMMENVSSPSWDMVAKE